VGSTNSTEGFQLNDPRGNGSSKIVARKKGVRTTPTARERKKKAIKKRGEKIWEEEVYSVLRFSMGVIS